MTSYKKQVPKGLQNSKRLLRNSIFPCSHHCNFLSTYSRIITKRLRHTVLILFLQFSNFQVWLLKVPLAALLPKNGNETFFSLIVSFFDVNRYAQFTNRRKKGEWDNRQSVCYYNWLTYSTFWIPKTFVLFDEKKDSLCRCIFSDIQLV